MDASLAKTMGVVINEGAPAETEPRRRHGLASGIRHGERSLHAVAEEGKQQLTEGIARVERSCDTLTL